MNFILLQVEKKYSQQQTTPFCLALPSQSYKALLYHSKFAVVERTKSYFIPFVDAEPGSWQESEVGAHAGTAPPILGAEGTGDSHAPGHWSCQQTLLQGRSGSTEPPEITTKGARPAQAGQGYQIHLLDCTRHVRSRWQGRVALDVIRMKCNEQSSLSALPPC